VTPDPIGMLARARAEFEQRVRGIRTDQLDDPTPCGGWTVRHVVDHVMAGDIFAARLLDGATIEEAVEGLLGVDLVGTDPLPDFRAGADAVAAAFARAGALDATVHHPAGDISGATFLEFRITDYTGHAWDLARATGQDENLDPELVAQLLAAVTARSETYSQSEHFGGGSTGGHDGSDLQTQLLDALGRRS
jgi:uncharacterized protein (TIGR03086 family)